MRSSAVGVSIGDFLDFSLLYLLWSLLCLVWPKNHIRQQEWECFSLSCSWFAWDPFYFLFLLKIVLCSVSVYCLDYFQYIPPFIPDSRGFHSGTQSRDCLPLELKFCHEVTVLTFAYLNEGNRFAHCACSVASIYIRNWVNVRSPHRYQSQGVP